MSGAKFPSYLPVTLVIGMVVFFHFVTLPEGHNWGGDFAQYIAQAKNLIAGKPLTETGYILNPDNPIAPATYPPVLSFLLVPVYLLFGLNFYAMKMLILSTFLLFLILFYHFCCGRMQSPLARLGAVGIAGFSPWLWEFNQQIVSEIPFLFFLFAAFFLADQLDRKDIDDRKRMMLAFITGFTMYLACGTRSAGILLVPALFASHFLKRRIDRTTFIALIVFFGCYLLQNIFLHNDKSYLVTSPALFKHFFSNIDGYYKTMLGYWGLGFSIPVRKATLLVTGLLAVVGFIANLRKNHSTAEGFLLLYLGLIFAYDWMVGIRYLIPLIPLYIMYIFCGLETIPAFLGIDFKKYITVGMLCLMSYSYYDSYTFRSFSGLHHGILTRESQEVFEYVRRNTPEDSVFIFFKPRVLSLFTGRKAAVYHETDNPRQLWQFFKKIKATHILVKFHSENLLVSDVHKEGDRVLQLIQPYLEKLEMIFENDQFRIYRINDLKSDTLEKMKLNF